MENIAPRYLASGWSLHSVSLTGCGGNSASVFHSTPSGSAEVGPPLSTRGGVWLLVFDPVGVGCLGHFSRAPRASKTPNNTNCGRRPGIGMGAARCVRPRRWSNKTRYGIPATFEFFDYLRVLHRRCLATKLMKRNGVQRSSECEMNGCYIFQKEIPQSISPDAIVDTEDVHNHWTSVLLFYLPPPFR